LKICVVTGTFHPEIGGPPTYLYHLLTALVEWGHEITVVTYGDVVQEFEYPYQVIRVSRRQSITVRLLQFTWQVWRVARGCDLIFVNGYGLPVAVVNWVLRKPVVMKIVGDFAWEYAIRHGLIDRDENIDDFQTKRHSLPVELLKRVQTFYARRANLIFTGSRYFRDVICHWGVPTEKVKTIYNSIDAADYVLSESKTSIRDRLELAGKIVVTVARLTPWKGVDKVMRALADLRPWVPDVRFLIVGDGPERECLERLATELGASEWVIFAGRVPHVRIPYYLKASDIFVLYSGFESGSAHVLLEAMVMGVPIVTSAKGGNPEVVENGISGMVVEWKDQQGLRDALLRLLRDESLSACLVEAAHERVERLFNWENLVPQVLMTFQAAMDGEGG
jgi:glycosyltransferase involved in cell wall biosynthesis